MPQINAIPRGYLDMLGTQTGGRNPPESVDAVSPVIEMTRFFDGPKLAAEVTNLTHSAIGNSISLPVPDNQMWVLYGVSVSQLMVLATDEVTCRVVLKNLPLTTTANEFAIFTSPLLSGRTVALETATAGIVLPQPLSLLPGTILRTYINQRSGTAAVALFTTYLVARFNA